MVGFVGWVVNGLAVVLSAANPGRKQ